MDKRENWNRKGCNPRIQFINTFELADARVLALPGSEHELFSLHIGQVAINNPCRLKVLAGDQKVIYEFRTTGMHSESFKPFIFKLAALDLIQWLNSHGLQDIHFDSATMATRIYDQSVLTEEPVTNFANQFALEIRGLQQLNPQDIT